MSGMAWLALIVIWLPTSALEIDERCVDVEGFGGCAEHHAWTVCVEVDVDGRTLTKRCPDLG